MKNNTFLNLFVIILIGILFRFWFLDKPEGLWNDEYVSWYTASIKDIHLFIEKIFQNCHTPLYYLYLKFWMFIFPDTDLSLRVSSVIPSLAGIIVMFFAGKELKDNKIGLLCAFLAAVSSFNIYFAQEVRLYSLLFMFSASALFYFIKAAKNPSKINIMLFISCHSLIILLHTLGIIYSCICVPALFLYLYKQGKFQKLKLNIIKCSTPIILVIIILLPFLYELAFTRSICQFWSEFSFSKIIFNFTDWFSPVQINIINTPFSLVSLLDTDGFNFLLFAAFVFTPVFIAFSALYNAIKAKNKILNYILAASFLFFMILIILCAGGKMILITKYSTEIYPSLLLGAAFGFTEINKSCLGRLTVTVFIFINLFYLLISNNAAQKISRNEGNAIPAELIKNSRLKQNDIILFTFYDKDRFERYLDNEKQYGFLSVNKFNFNCLMFNCEDFKTLQQNGKYLYRDYFKEFPNKKVLEYSKNFIYNETKAGDKVGIIFLDTVSFLSNQEIQDILSNDKKLKHTPFLFIVFSAFKNSIMYSLKNDYKIDTINTCGDWTLIVYEKK